MREKAASGPSWDLLYEVAASEAGSFTSRQAVEVGFSLANLTYHQRVGNLIRAHRGVYRLARFPAMDQEMEELVVVWLASDREGVFSHETALALHQLSDVLPSRLHLTLPSSWRRRKLPGRSKRHYASVAADETAWMGPVPVTTPERTLRDCVAAHVSPELVAQALRQALSRGIVPPPLGRELKVE